jgi:hypothetical protein
VRARAVPAPENSGRQSGKKIEITEGVASFAAPSNERFRYLARPIILSAFILLTAALGRGEMTLAAAIFFALAILFLGQSYRLALSVADRVVVGKELITYRVCLGTHSAPLDSVRKAQLLERGDRENPRRIARFVLDRGEFWVSDRLRGFDRLVNHPSISNSASSANGNAFGGCSGVPDRCRDVRRQWIHDHCVDEVTMPERGVTLQGQCS